MRAEVIESAPGVFMVAGPRTNWCLLRSGDGITLVDAAWPKDYALVTDSLRQIGASPDHVKAVVLTHAHPDHIGVAERLRSEQGSSVHTHRNEVRHATGEVHERVRAIELIARVWRPSVAAFAFDSITSGATKPTPVAEVTAFDDGPIDVPGHPLPIPTPGHTSGHCSFHLVDHGIVVSGDALVSRNVLTNRPGPRLMPRIFNHDWEQAAASLDALSGLDADVILPGHGPVLYMTPAEAVATARQQAATAGWWDR